MLSGTTALASGAPASATGSLLALPIVVVERSAAHPAGTSYQAIRYRPRYHHPPQAPPPSRPTGFMQLHGGAFDPDGGAADQWLVGFRAGGSHDAVQLGVAADYGHRSFTEEVVIAESVDPTGHVVTTTVETFSTSSHLVPVMAFVQVAAPAPLPLRPYFGVGGGYEVMVLDSRDFQTGEAHRGTFHGWGWQVWGGAALALGPRTNLVGEIFANDATLQREVDRFENGQPVREEVDADGVGLRVGLQFGF
jgi:hypothetical protein